MAKKKTRRKSRVDQRKLLQRYLNQYEACMGLGEIQGNTLKEFWDNADYGNKMWAIGYARNSDAFTKHLRKLAEGKVPKSYKNGCDHGGPQCLTCFLDELLYDDYSPETKAFWRKVGCPFTPQIVEEILEEVSG